MILVCAAFIVCLFPSTFYFYFVDYKTQTANDIFVGYYATVFLSYLYVCMNPFIYAVKHEGVKEKLADLMVWRDINYSHIGDFLSSRSLGLVY